MDFAMQEAFFAVLPFPEFTHPAGKDNLYNAYPLNGTFRPDIGGFVESLALIHGLMALRTKNVCRNGMIV